MDKLKVIFMGTPDFAVPSLAALVDKTEVICVVTQPDKPKGRGHKLQPPPVKIFAEENNLRVIQPPKVKARAVVDELAALHPDLIVVVAFGQILSQKILDIPRFGCINVHASLLPKYRGAAPIEWSIIRGEKVTGITTMQMNAGLDTGDILLQSEVKISDEMLLSELRERLMTVGADLLLKTLYKLQRGELQPIKQDDSLSTYAPLLTRETGLIDWKKSAREIHDLVRGLHGAARAGKFKIWRTRLAAENLSAGEIKIVGGKFFVGTGDGALEILEIQAPSSKKMSAADFLRGNKVGDNFWTKE
ncbi:MAG: methionyl-tRNA formyltransferase [Selenomonadaceae bacterium]|nr:methionyl-tRNA formyltransferase [Selenomonadaceae bacterium]MBQ9496195.1 methionyl-tRNA formyltransferase [Selenomonadaceae bacterium]